MAMDLKRYGWITCTAMERKIIYRIAGNFYQYKINKVFLCYVVIIQNLLLLYASIMINRFDGWSIHDCERTESAGVQCKDKPPPTTPTPPPTTPRYI